MDREVAELRIEDSHVRRCLEPVLSVREMLVRVVRPQLVHAIRRFKKKCSEPSSFSGTRSDGDFSKVDKAHLIGREIEVGG
jgi:hypothetical protein